MHFHFDFSAPQIIWTLTFAAQLVLLVVLLGRDRARRYPWFTAGIALSGLQLMAEVLLKGRMPTLELQEILLPLADLGVMVGLLVVAEVARRAFAGAKRSQWIVNGAGLLLAAGGVLIVWGPWPVGKDLAWDTLLGRLRMMQLAAQKGDLLVALLTVGLGLLVVLVGRQFKAGWRSHTQKIAIGLSTIALASLAIQAALETIIRTAHPHSQQEYDRIFGLPGGFISRLLNANSVVYLAALIWWIAWLWLDEPGTEETEPTETAPD
jgi:hypothetical protein